MELSPENIQQKTSSFFYINSTKINSEQKNKSLSTIYSNINSKNLSEENPQKLETPLDFIIQKKKFNLDSIFNAKGTKDFLASKEKAMMEIQLDDEINHHKKHKKKRKNSTLIQIKYPKIESKNEGNIKNKNKIKKKSVTFISKEDKHNNIRIKKAPTKKKIDTKFNNMENKKNVQNSKDYNDNTFLIIDKLNENSQESNYFYKFILNNVNDSEDIFYKKYENMAKSVENKLRKNKKCKKLSKKKKKLDD